MDTIELILTATAIATAIVAVSLAYRVGIPMAEAWIEEHNHRKDIGVALYQAGRELQRQATADGLAANNPRDTTLWNAGAWLCEEKAPEASGLSLFTLHTAACPED